MTRLLLRTLPFVLAVALFSHVAQADDAVKCGEAEVIFREGLKKRQAGDYIGALPLLKQSLALCRSPGLGALYNIAIAEDKLGRTTASYLHYAEFLRDVRTTDVRIIDVRIEDAKKIMTRMRAEGTTLRFLNLDKLPSNTSVSLDDALVGSSTAGYEVPAEPSDHLIVIREPGQSERRLSVNVVRGESRDVDVLPPPPPPTFTPRKIGFVVGGVGVASLLTGAMTGAVALSMRHELTTSCSKPEFPCTTSEDVNGHIAKGKALGDASTATFIIGGALTAIGATLILLPPTKSKEIALAPLVLPGGGGLSFSTRF